MANEKINFGIFSNEKKKTEQAYISLDKQGRVYMNADAQKFFGVEKGKSVDLQIGYTDGVIYLIKVDSKFADKEAKPFRFSGERAYASAKTLIENSDIAPKGEAKSVKYLHVKTFTAFEGVFAFKNEAIVAAEEAEAAANAAEEAAKLAAEAEAEALAEAEKAAAKAPKAPKAPKNNR